MDLDHTKTLKHTQPEAPELERAIDAFLTGDGSDDFDKVMASAQRLEAGTAPAREGPSERRKPKKKKRAPEQAASGVARWIPRFKSRKKELDPTPDPRRLPPAERALSPEPRVAFSGEGAQAAAPPAPAARVEPALRPVVAAEAHSLIRPFVTDPAPFLPPAGAAPPGPAAAAADPMVASPRIITQELPAYALEPLEEEPEVRAEAPPAPTLDTSPSWDGAAGSAGPFDLGPALAGARSAVSLLSEELRLRALIEEPAPPAPEVDDEEARLRALIEGDPAPPDPGVLPRPQALEAAGLPHPQAPEAGPAAPELADASPTEEIPRAAVAERAAEAALVDAQIDASADDPTAVVSPEQIADAFLLAELGTYDAPPPPPTADVGAAAEEDPFHRSVDGIHPTTEWRTFAPKERQAVAQPAPALVDLGDALEEAAPAGLPQPTLADALRRARETLAQGFELPPCLCLTERVRAIARACEPVAAAHDAGRAHGDLRPANLHMGAYGDVTVTGWDGSAPLGDRIDLGDVEAGFYQISGDAGRLQLRTSHGLVVGSPHYLAPERLNGVEAGPSPAADVFALGVMLFEAAHLSPAFDDGPLDRVLAQVAAGRLAHPAPPEGAEAPPRSLKALIARATAADAGGRFGDAGALLAALKVWLGERRPPRAPRWRFAAGGAVAATTAAALLAGTVGVHELDGLRADVDQVAAQADEIKTLARLSVEVGDQAHRISRIFDHYHALVGGLAASAAEVRRHAPLSREAQYRLFEFRTEGRQPEDLQDSPVYKGPISLEHPMYKLAPSGDFDALRDEARRVLWLNDRLRGAFFAAAAHGATEAAIEAETVRERGLPVHRAFLSWDSGLDVIFPGQAGYPDAWEGRAAPHVVSARGAAGPVWGVPFAEMHGAGLVLPITAPIASADGEVYGVAGFELSMDRLASRTLPMADLPGFDGGWLVDDDRYVRVGQGLMAPAEGQKTTSVPLPVAGLGRAMAAEDAGHITVEGGREAFWAPIPATGWSYVVLVDPARVPAGGMPATLSVAQRD